MIYYADDNDGYKYLLVVIDIFSRYGWVQPLNDKTAKEIVSAFDKILKEGRIPKCLRTDAAKDFTSERFQNYVESKNITSIATVTGVPTVTGLPTIIKPKVETYIPTEEDRAQMKKESEEEETITVTGEQATE